MKGHVKIELFDHKTGKRKTTEHRNMLTNALAYRAGIDSNDTMNLYSSEYSLLPLGTKGLGGLFLFDGPLTEDAGNIHFPMDVHLTGCAGRGAGSPASNLQGTIDSTAASLLPSRLPMRGQVRPPSICTGQMPGIRSAIPTGISWRWILRRISLTSVITTRLPVQSRFIRESCHAIF